MKGASPPSSLALARVARGDLCAGCGACAGLAGGKITMETTAGGHARPVQVEALDAREEGLIRDVCPGLSMERPVGAAADHVLWGPHRGVFVGHARDGALRRRASSGGGLSALLIHLLESGAVRFIVQTTASTEDPLGNETTTSADAGDVFEAAGSRYAPSSPLADLEAHLARDEPFAFVGKPCDVAALRAIARRDARVEERVPYMISFFCAGAPSARGAEEVIRKLGATPGDVRNFRYRGDGWPGFATARLKTGETLRLSYADSWGAILSKHLPFRCKICPDGVGGFADIVFADAWECDANGYPLFEEAEGRSLMVPRTEKGAAALEAAVAAGAISARAIDIDAVAAMQPGQVRRKTRALSRLVACRLFMRPTPRFKGFSLKAAARRAGLFANLRSFLGTGRRLVFARRR